MKSLDHYLKELDEYFKYYDIPKQQRVTKQKINDLRVLFILMLRGINFKRIALYASFPSDVYYHLGLTNLGIYSCEHYGIRKSFRQKATCGGTGGKGIIIMQFYRPL